MQIISCMIPELAAIVANYAGELDVALFEKLLLLEMLSFNMANYMPNWYMKRPMHSLPFPVSWQIDFVHDLCNDGFYCLGMRSSGYWSWFDYPAHDHCFRQRCSYFRHCSCTEPLTRDYLLSHLQNGDYYMY